MSIICWFVKVGLSFTTRNKNGIIAEASATLYILKASLFNKIIIFISHNETLNKYFDKIYRLKNLKTYLEKNNVH